MHELICRRSELQFQTADPLKKFIVGHWNPKQAKIAWKGDGTENVEEMIAWNADVLAIYKFESLGLI
jgi:hypothetical protein